MEKPILLSAPMVRAILDGRKTMTRRVIKPQPSAGFRLWGRVIDDHASWTDHPQGEKGQIIRAKCPYGAPGDRAWVRETWCPTIDGKSVAYYRASIDPRLANEPTWKPSIFMPRWASRITLRITGVRVERLQGISEEDAKAEGLAFWSSEEKPEIIYYGASIADVWETDPRLSFRRLWDSINGNRASWDDNPWVWVVEFVVAKTDSKLTAC